MSRISAASNGHAAVAIQSITHEDGQRSLVVLKYAPSSVGTWERRDEFRALVKRAAAKQGFHPDRRFKGGWRYSTV